MISQLMREYTYPWLEGSEQDLAKDYKRSGINPNR